MKCPMCGERASEEGDEDPRRYICPTCGLPGFECCFPAGVGTKCLTCEEGVEPDDADNS